MNKLQTQFDVSSLLLSDNSIHFDVHGVFDVKYAGNETSLVLKWNRVWSMYQKTICRNRHTASEIGYGNRSGNR